MRKIKFILLLTGLLSIATLISCSKENDLQQVDLQNIAGQQVPNHSEASRVTFPDGSSDATTWTANATMVTSLPNTTDTNFMKGQVTALNNFWKVQGEFTAAVELFFVKDNVKPSSTFAAVYYPNYARILYGEAIYNHLKTIQSNVAPVYALAHEYGHHLQTINGWSVGINGELEATAMAGYYMRKGLGKTTIASVQPTISNAIGSGPLHGTQAQQTSAFRLGFSLGAAATKLTPEQFHAKFFQNLTDVKNGRLF
jgi:uncharacterized protein